MVADEGQIVSFFGSITRTRVALSFIEEMDRFWNQMDYINKFAWRKLETTGDTTLGAP
jgi:hypothetical protein